MSWRPPSSLSSRSPDLPHKHQQRIIVLIHHPLLQRNNGVIGDVNILRTHLRAALRNVAESQPQLLLQYARPRNSVKRMHLQRSRTHKETRPSKLLLFAMLPQNMTHILTKKALNALAKL